MFMKKHLGYKRPKVYNDGNYNFNSVLIRKKSLYQDRKKLKKATI